MAPLPAWFRRWLVLGIVMLAGSAASVSPASPAFAGCGDDVYLMPAEGGSHDTPPHKLPCTGPDCHLRSAPVGPLVPVTVAFEIEIDKALLTIAPFRVGGSASPLPSSASGRPVTRSGDIFQPPRA